MFSSLDISSTKIESRSNSAGNIYLKLGSILMFFFAYYKMFKVAAEEAPFIARLTEFILGALLHLTLAILLGYGRKITVDFQSSTIKDEKLFLWFVYSADEHMLVGIGRGTGEEITDPHQLYAETNEGERISLIELNRWEMDEKWETVKETVEDQFLMKNE